MDSTQQLELFPDLPPPGGSWIYFGLGADGRIKIGWTTRPIKVRGGELRIRILLAVPGGELDEYRYHRQYKAERLGQSEWFFPTPRLLRDLHDMCAESGWENSAQLLSSMLRGQERKVA